MSSTGEGNAPTADPPVEKPKPVKEKKPKGPKETKPKQAKTASHPPYFQMIKDALLVLNEKGGSSPYAIAKYMEEKHKTVLPANFRKILALQLKNQTARGKLIKIKASYKLSEAAKKDKDKTTKITRSTKEKNQQRPKESKAATTTAGDAPKATLSKKTETAKKKDGVKKTRKVSPAKPKQPKSIRSPAKRARKAAA